MISGGWLLIKHKSKLVLGTAQLGLDYGIANEYGKLSKEEAIDIIKTAWRNEITVFDTAPAYGSSEELLGDFIKSGKSIEEKITIITKLSKRNSAADIVESVTNNLRWSMDKLGVNKIDYLLLHDPEDISNKYIINALKNLKDEDLITEFGASIYSIEEAEIAINKGFSVLQVPANLFDHRFISEKLINEFKQQHITVFVRSIFLQGLLFLNPLELPSHLAEAKPYLTELLKICNEWRMPLHELAVKFINNIAGVDHILVGALSAEQLSSNIKAFEDEHLPHPLKERIIDIFKDVPEDIIDPRCWTR